jgi:hypothetical protein
MCSISYHSSADLKKKGFRTKHLNRAHCMSEKKVSRLERGSRDSSLHSELHHLNVIPGVGSAYFSCLSSSIPYSNFEHSQVRVESSKRQRLGGAVCITFKSLADAKTYWRTFQAGP